MKEKKLLCPFCKNDVFIRSATEKPCRVYILKDEEGDLRDEDIDMCVTEYTYKCAGCGKNITEEELAKK